MNLADRLAAYGECKKRGHTPSGVTLASYPPWQVCKYCATHYRIETVVREGNAPEEPDGFTGT